MKIKKPLIIIAFSLVALTNVFATKHKIRMAGIGYTAINGTLTPESNTNSSLTLFVNSARSHEIKIYVTDKNREQFVSKSIDELVKISSCKMGHPIINYKETSDATENSYTITFDTKKNAIGSYVMVDIDLKYKGVVKYRIAMSADNLESSEDSLNNKIKKDKSKKIKQSNNNMNVKPVVTEEKEKEE
ncbi:MAG: hypothetical protein HRT87_02030 [Legionellales bacterium]|nr:hypothetical protein [Legionellales bacterium]